jgi:hypothetical protein
LAKTDSLVTKSDGIGAQDKLPRGYCKQLLYPLTSVAGVWRRGGG